MKKNDGGPAFPTQTFESPSGEFQWGQDGVSLRDYAAIKSLTGMLAHPTRYKPRPGASENWHEAIAEEAYQIADAMLAERDKSNA